MQDATAIVAQWREQNRKLLEQNQTLARAVADLTAQVGGLTDRVENDDENLINQIRGSPVVNADETRWWVGGPGLVAVDVHLPGPDGVPVSPRPRL